MNDHGLVLRVRLLSKQAVPPVRAHETDAGLDLCAVHDFVLEPGAAWRIGTGLALAIPDGWYGQIFGRSSVGASGIAVLGGVIDSSYRGEVQVVLANVGQVTYEIRAGRKIAQLVILPVPRVAIEVVDELDQTTRGTSGFGSTGR